MTANKVIEQVKSCKNIISATRHTLEELKKRLKKMEDNPDDIDVSKLNLKEVDDRDIMID